MSTNTKFIATSVIVAIGVLAMDIALPLGVAVGLPYVALVLLGLWAPGPRYVYLAAVVGTLLTTVGYFLSPAGGTPLFVLTNRGEAIFAIWITAILCNRTLRDRVQLEAVAAKELQRSEEHYQFLFENTPISIMELDYSDVAGWMDGLREKGIADLASYLRDNPDELDEALGRTRVTAVNDAGLGPRHMALTREIRAPFLGRSTPETRDACTKLIENIWNGEHRFELELSTFDHQNTPLDLATRWAAPVVDGKIDLSRVIMAATDISEERRAEERLMEAQRMEAVGQLAGGVAHDFNNVLTVIVGYAAMILEQTRKTDPLRKYADVITRSAERAASITRQLLAFSQKQQVRSEAIDLTTVLSTLEPVLRRTLKENIDLDIRLMPHPGIVEADPAQMEQIILNLVMNANDAMRRGGCLTIEVANAEFRSEHDDHGVLIPAGSYTTLKVSDTGIGMDPATRSRIFEPFFTTKDRSKTTGLGLSAVYGIVKKNGGSVSVISEPGVGTTFTIYLPTMSITEQDPEKDHVRMLPLKQTILVVDDDQDLMTMTSETLRSQGFRTVTASDPQKALEIFQSSDSIDLVLTDVIMPGMSGPDMVRQMLSVSKVNVVFMSGYTDDVIESTDLVSQDNFLQKPFTPASLREKLEVVFTPTEESP